MNPTERTQSLLPFGLAPKRSGAGLSIKLRFTLLAGGMMAVFCVALLLLRQIERFQIEKVVAGARADAARQLARLIDTDAFALRQVARDFRAGAFAEPLAAVAGEARASRLRELAIAYGVDAIWLADRGGAIEALGSRGGAPIRSLPVPFATIETAAETPLRGFLEQEGALWEVVVARRPASEAGWFVAARRWDEARIEALAAQLDGRVRLLGPGEQDSVGPSEVAVLQELPDFSGRAVRVLHAARSKNGIVQALHTDSAMIRLFIAFGVALLVGLGLAVQGWVLRPLQRIAESVAQESAAPLEGLVAGEEIARLAQLAEQSFNQKSELQREVGERRRAEARLQQAQEHLRQSVEIRSRLARNLHDSVIQSIYATGLGLERARGELESDPVAAAARLAHCRTNLNETIREVRGFINDLEPESLRRQPFAQALRGLAYTMQSLWVATIAVELDEAVTQRFTPAQETHILQIVREAISNSLRHGEASRIQILLQPDADGRNALLKVQDNGRGFDPARRTGTGHGLVNMSNRASEMGGSLRLQTEPGAGTTLVLRVPLPEAAT